MILSTKDQNFKLRYMVEEVRTKGKKNEEGERKDGGIVRVLIFGG